MDFIFQQPVSTARRCSECPRTFTPPPRRGPKPSVCSPGCYDKRKSRLNAEYRAAHPEARRRETRARSARRARKKFGAYSGASLSHAEIAKLWNCTPQNIQNIEKKALAKLRKRLEVCFRGEVRRIGARDLVTLLFRC